MLQSKLRYLQKHRLPFLEPYRCLSGAADQLLGSLTDYEKTGLPSRPRTREQHKFDLARMSRLLDTLQNPQCELKVVHIAGTKGKGSVATMLASILHASEYNAGLYTSPHILGIQERIVVQGRPIAGSVFDGLAERWSASILDLQRVEQGNLTHFEVLTALAFRHFADSKVDIAVVETGVGGTLDATNVFDEKQLELNILTPIGLEHRALLGNSLEEIAKAKAGICKQGVTCIIGSQQPEAVSPVKQAVTAAGAVLLPPSDVVRVEALDISLGEQTAEQKLEVTAQAGQFAPDIVKATTSTNMLGKHQAENAATALTAALQLRKRGWQQITFQSCLAGISSAALQGRSEVKKTKSGDWLVLDGAHTVDSARTVAETLRAVFPDNPVALVIAMADDKDHAGVLKMLRRIRPHVVVFTTVPIAGSSARSAPPGMLAGQWQAANFEDDRPLRCRELLQANMASAIRVCERELAAISGTGVLCITGSLHAVGAATSHFLGQ